jgi:hypothetical protein
MEEVLWFVGPRSLRNVNTRDSSVIVNLAVAQQVLSFFRASFYLVTMASSVCASKQFALMISQIWRSTLFFSFSFRGSQIPIKDTAACNYTGWFRSSCERVRTQI